MIAVDQPFVEVEGEDGETRVRRRRAQYHWIDDGQMMVSIHASAVDVLSDGRCLVHGWDDLELPQRLVPWPRKADAQAALLADWVLATEADVPAALALEPFRHPESDRVDARLSVYEDDEEPGFAFLLDVSPAAVAALREQLAARSAAYLATRDALTDPASSGRRLLMAAVEDVRDGADAATLLRGDWIAGARP